MVSLLSKGSEEGSMGSFSPPDVLTGAGGFDPKTGEIRWLVLGDSLSQGIGAPDPATGAFPVLLAAKWRAEGLAVVVKNVAVKRFTVEDMIRVELPEIAAFAPTLVTFQGGSNDVANGVPLETFRKNVKTVLEAAKKSGARVLVMPQNEWFRAPDGPSYGKDLARKRAAYDAVLVEETNAAGAELLDLRLLFRQQADKKMWNREDGIHPTAEAYAGWADELARILPAPRRG